MQRVIIAVLLSLIAAGADAQVRIKPKVNMSMYNSCLNSAVKNDDVTDKGKYIEYLCFGETAQRWWNSIGPEGQRDVHDRKYGRFISKYYGNSGYCAHHIEDSSGNGVNGYVCSIETEAPD